MASALSTPYDTTTDSRLELKIGTEVYYGASTIVKVHAQETYLIIMLQNQA
jgi:hypothetical protein